MILNIFLIIGTIVGIFFMYSKEDVIFVKPTRFDDGNRSGKVWRTFLKVLIVMTVLLLVGFGLCVYLISNL